ncbi:hypothetical protein J6590_071584 [Homalodisca vitripennis]|nr:hypothetical protein J6590_071584 [Homalodisca vitripennis]
MPILYYLSGESSNGNDSIQFRYPSTTERQLPTSTASTHDTVGLALILSSYLI